MHRCRLKAGNGTRTRDPNLGKVVLYQLSYSRAQRNIPGRSETKQRCAVITVITVITVIMDARPAH
jgi:hypothetical protein